MIVTPLRGAARFYPAESAEAMALVNDPDAGREAPGPALVRLYGLSRREAQIAAALAAGLDLEACAARLGIARNTARYHLYNVFRKTGVSRQSDLVRLISALPLRA
ncbi:MAG: hypothetical protein GC201_01275 [Alphaproteobacteria bacterium]|nr:hypothetical protein [Alphaproteobacteria bacterium]